MTPDIAYLDTEHQFFLTGSAVDGPATVAASSAVLDHAYADQDGNGLPVGLTNTITTLGLGSGELTVTLRHLPPEDGKAVKVVDMADEVATSGFGAIGGDNDIHVTFDVTVE